MVTAQPFVIVGGSVEAWGFIPGFLDPADPRSAQQQIARRHPGGWREMEGFSFDYESGVLSYPGDPPLSAISMLIFRDELLLLFPHAWVVIAQPDGSWQVARLD